MSLRKVSKGVFKWVVPKEIQKPVARAVKKVGNKMLNPIRRDMEFKRKMASPSAEAKEQFRQVRGY